MSSILNYDSLLEEYKRKKQELFDTDDSLRRITGREKPYEVTNRGASKYKRRSPISDRTYSERKRALYSKGKYGKDERESPDEREDSPDERELDSSSKRPSMQSTIVAKHQHRSRKATIEKLNANSKVKARNRRMFGALLGTLEQFKHEEKKRQPKESMRTQIELKVEAATEEEKEKVKKEKDYLVSKRQETKQLVRCYEKQLERAESHEVYEATYKTILESDCIMTKTEPHIFFKPVSHTAATKRFLCESRSTMKGLLAVQKSALEADLAEIKESYQKDSVLSNEENKCLKDESESQDVLETESESLVVEQEDTFMEEEDELINDRHILGGSLEDQDFEPIYD